MLCLDGITARALGSVPDTTLFMIELGFSYVAAAPLRVLIDFAT